MPKHKIIRKKLSSKLAYRNPYFRIWEDSTVRPDSKKSKYYWVQTHPAVFVVPVTDKLETYLVGQYRYPVKDYCLEVVAGGSEGKNPLAMAKRELWEETGFVAKKWKRISRFYPWNGVAGEIDYVYIAEGLTQTGKNKQAEEGIDQLLKVPLKKTLAMIRKGEITDGQSIAALTQAALYLRLIES